MPALFRADTSSPDQGESWFAFSAAGMANLEDLAENGLPPVQIGAGNWVLRARVVTGCASR